MNRPAGASSPVSGSYRSPPEAGAWACAFVPPAAPASASASVRVSDSTRAARFAEGREKEYAIAISSKCRSGYSMVATALKAATSSPTASRSSSTSAEPYQTTVISRMPGSSTWIAEIRAHILALRTAALRTSCEASR